MPPREVARVQVHNHCAITYEILTMDYAPQLAEVKAHLASGVPLGSGWAYRPDGFASGDTVSFVIPEVECGDVHLAGPGFGRTNPPFDAPPVRSLK